MTTRVITASPSTRLADVVALLVEHDIGAIPIVDEAGALVGVVTEADVLTSIAYPAARGRTIALLDDILRGRDARWVGKAGARTAAQCMSAHVLTTSPEAEVVDVAREMLASRVKQMPVVEAGRLVGIVARHDVLRAFVASGVGDPEAGTQS